MRATEYRIIPTGLFAKTNTRLYSLLYFFGAFFGKTTKKYEKVLSLLFASAMSNMLLDVPDVFALKAQVLRFASVLFFSVSCVCLSPTSVRFCIAKIYFCSGTKVYGNAIRFSVDIVTVIVAVVFVNSSSLYSVLSQRIPFRTTVNRNEVIRRCAP